MEKKFSEDSYFFNVEEAKKESLKNNDVFQDHPSIFGKQICYYNADEKVDGLPENCIWVSLENFYNFFSTTKYRLPTKVVISENDLDDPAERELLCTQLYTILNIAINSRNNLLETYIQENKKLKLDFKDKKLRVFISTSRYTTVMQYVSRAIYEAFEQNEHYEVKFFIEETLFEPINDMLPTLVEYHNFNPHIVININHFNNEFLNEDVFNFIWFQDSMPIVTNENSIFKRKRDFVYSLLPGIKNKLEEKGIESKLQEFCINRSIFKIIPSIKKEKKIVFIGSSYRDNMNSYLNVIGDLKEEIEDNKKDLIIGECLEHYKQNGIFENIFQHALSSKYNISIEYIHNYILPLVIRDYTLLELVKMSIDYEIEVYGLGWDKYESLKPYYKGVLEYGEEICRIYNSATYALVAHSNYIVQQRTLESAASNCIPIAYDSRLSNPSETFLFENNLLLFQNLKDLERILKKEPIKINLEPIVEYYSYDNFIKKITTQIENTLNEDS